MKMKFLQWLTEQHLRDDVIGDLAKDFVADGEPKDFSRSYLRRKNVHKKVLIAFNEAIEEYNRLFTKDGIICMADLDYMEHIEHKEKFFGYIMEHGWISLKRYTTKARYKEIKDDDLPLFIPVFEARGWLDAKIKIKKILENALNQPTNNWEWEIEINEFEEYYGETA